MTNRVARSVTREGAGSLWDEASSAAPVDDVEGKALTNSAHPVVDPWSDRDQPSPSASVVASWAVRAAAARAALAMIPTSPQERTRQAPLVRELAHAAARRPGVDPDEASRLSAGQLVETTLTGLREPASARPYDQERAQGLRRQVLAFVVAVADELAGAALPARVDDRTALIGAVRAGRLAEGVLADEPVSTSR